MLPGRTAFRTDIEGLRGVAILLVVLFHAGVSGLEGGYVGVDVFFVLSGFFITGLLARELTETERVDLNVFWGRRALRLLPPLLVVLMATIVAVMVLSAPIDRAGIMSTARSVALYGGNIEFARNAVDYFSSGENPLLHTWSLAVEEQFYLVWPLVFLFVGLFLGGRQGDDDAARTSSARRQLLFAVGFAGAASFIASAVLTTISQPWAFFGMPTRIWEFALGGVVAIVLTDRRDAESSIATLLQIAGLFMIGMAVLFFDKGTAYPGFAALLPSLGTVALLVGGQRAPEGLVSRALSVASLRWLGRVSYAWYLWHWPVLVVTAMIDPAIGAGGRVLRSALALMLAWWTYRVVEGSARDGRLSQIPGHRLAPLALAASVTAALIAHGAMLVAERQAARPEQTVFAAAREDRVHHDCWATTIDTPPKGSCEFGDLESSTTVALLGDSHAEHWLGGLDRAGRERGWKIVAMVKGGCPVADAPEMTNARRKRYYEQCARYREAMIQRIIATRPAAVILSSWDHYMPLDGKASGWQVTPEAWERGLRRTYSRLAAAGIRMIVIRDVPRTWFDVPACLSRREAGLLAANGCEYTRAGSISPIAIAAQNSAARGLPVHFVDMNDQVCGAARCGVIRHGEIVFTDDNHLTASFSRSLGPVLATRLAKLVD